MSEETRVSFRWDLLVDVYRPLAFHLSVLWSCDISSSSFFLFFSLFSSFSFLMVGFLVVLQVLLPADDWMIGWVRCASVVRYLPTYLPTAYRYPLPYEAYEA